MDVDSTRPRDLVNEYKQALEQSSDEKGELPSNLYRTLMSRDRLGQKLGLERPADVVNLQQIVELDEQLRQKARAVRRSLDPEIFEQWRKVLLPDDSAWWWQLDSELSPSPLWMVIAALLFTASLTLFWDNSSKLITVRPDLAVAATTISQGLLAILTGSSFTEAGRRWTGRILSRLGIPPRRHHIWLTALAGLTLPEEADGGSEVRRFEHYEVILDDNGRPIELGRGATGITYKAFDVDLRCPVTLKVIRERYVPRH